MICEKEKFQENKSNGKDILGEIDKYLTLLGMWGVSHVSRVRWVVCEHGFCVVF